MIALVITFLVFQLDEKMKKVQKDKKLAFENMLKVIIVHFVPVSAGVVVPIMVVLRN